MSKAGKVLSGIKEQNEIWVEHLIRIKNLIFKQEVNSLKNNKSAGADHLSTEILKHLKEKH